MFNPTEIVIQAFVQHLQNMYGQIYGVLEPAYPDIIGFVARLSLENIADSDAAYHDMNHTIMVTLVGQEILRGKQLTIAIVPAGTSLLPSGRISVVPSLGGNLPQFERRLTSR